MTSKHLIALFVIAVSLSACGAIEPADDVTADPPPAALLPPPPPPRCDRVTESLCDWHPFALRAVCAPEIATVCAADPYCCGANLGHWDWLCVDEVRSIALRNTCGEGRCAIIYSVGPARDPNCGETVDAVCSQAGGRLSCCTTWWDSVCVSMAKAMFPYGVATPGRPPCGDGHVDPGETWSNCGYDVP